MAKKKSNVTKKQKELYEDVISLMKANPEMSQGEAYKKVGLTKNAYYKVKNIYKEPLQKRSYLRKNIEPVKKTIVNNQEKVAIIICHVENLGTTLNGLLQ